MIHASMSKTAIAGSLRTLAALPDWLTGAVQPDRLRASLLNHVPEFALGDLALRSCEVKRIELKGRSERWTGSYSLVVEDPRSGESQVVRARGTLTPPDVGEAPDYPGYSTAGIFGTEGWRCYLPDLRLELRAETSDDESLEAMPRLTDPLQARAVLEEAIRSVAPLYRELRIEACKLQVLSFKPGSSCVIRYDLDYPTNIPSSNEWPRTIIAKVYRSGKGENAFAGMRALWDSPLANSDVVSVAEPLAYLPDLRTLLQRPLEGDRNLEDLLKVALNSDAPEGKEELYRFVLKAAEGLAALHNSGVQYRREVTWGDFMVNVHDLTGRLAAIVPQVAYAAKPIANLLEEISGSYSPGAPLPSHGTLAPEQVLINDGRIGFIDFDDFCQAEPAMDVGRFCAAIKDAGMPGIYDGANAEGSAPPSGKEAFGARLAELDALADAFISRYESLAPISRQRVTLWEGTDFLKHALHCWLKVKPSRTGKEMVLLEHYLRNLKV